MRPAALVAFCIAMGATAATAQMPIPEAAPPDGAKLFRNQCATCHTLHASEPKRQGPTLEHVYDRKIGSIEDYAYTAGYRESDGKWTAENLDKYLINPAAMFPGSTMAYRQANAITRQAIIAYLKDQS